MKSVAFVDQRVGIHSIDIEEVQAGALARNHPDFKGRFLKYQMGEKVNERRMMMKKRFILVCLVVMLLMMAQGCRWWDHDEDCCEDHDGVAMCYRPTGASHGHIMCRDGHTCHEECY